jgi:hypothetical protein
MQQLHDYYNLSFLGYSCLRYFDWQKRTGIYKKSN